MERRPVSITCKHCRKDVVFPKSVVEKGRKYCSAACKYADYNENGWPKENGTDRICEVCAAPFRVTPSTRVGRFCSQACMFKWRGPILRAKKYQPEKHATKTCGWCGSSFTTHTCRLDGIRGMYCSRSCVGSATVASFKDARISKAEVAFGDAMRAEGLIFEPQVRCSKWTVDFMFHAHQLAVEFDGDYWHSLERVKKVDAEKTAHLNALGYSVLRISDSFVRRDLAGAIALVRGALERDVNDKQTSSSAR